MCQGRLPWSKNVAVRCRTEQTIYVPDKDYVWSEPSTPPSPQCPAAQSLNEENSADTEDKADSPGMLNFTYPVSTLTTPHESLAARYI